MTDLSGRLEQLSPAKRALLEKLARRAAPARPAEDAIRPREESGPAPLSFGQQRFWFLDRLQPGTPLYTVPAVFRLRGRLDVRAMERAFAEVVARHDALRTVFREVEGEPRQVVLPAVATPVGAADLRGAPDGEAERRVREWLRLPFDLSFGPLVRAFAVRTGEDAWVLAFAVHHVASDGWSQGIFLRELSAAYARHLGGEGAPPPPPRVQYPDYAVWLRGWMRGTVLEEQLAWWKGRLGSGAPVLELPGDRPRPLSMSQRGAKLLASLPADLADGAEALARREGATPFMVLLAAFHALLGRLSGEEEVRVATPVANRGRPETEGTIGFFVNTVVLRGDLSADPTFRELLARVREETLGAFARSELPFERLVEELQPDRSLAHGPLAQVSFALQNASDETLRLPGCEVEETSPDLGVATLDLDFHLRRSARGLEVMARYSTDLFDPSTIARLAERYGRLLRAALAAPDSRVSSLPLLDAEERRTALAGWGDAGPVPAPERTVDALFAEQAERTPDAPALSFGGETLTYAELHRRADALARELAARGVGPDARVGLCTPRSAGMVVGMLAILRAGGAYVPLDPDYPAERLAFMVADAGVRVLVVHPGLEMRFEGFDGEVVAVEPLLPPGPPPPASEGRGENDSVEGEDASVDMPLPHSWGRVASLSEPGGGAGGGGHTPEHLAYVIYTSGSTGRPKGVAVPHRGVVRLVRDADLVRFGPGDRVAQVASASFDAATWEVWGALLNGGCLVGIERETALNPRGLAEALRRERVTAMFLTSALFTQTVREAPDAFATVAHLVVGGDAVDPGAARKCLEAGPPGRLLNGYGPTENTTFSTWHHIDAEAAGGATVPIGRAVAGSTAYVLDRWMEPVPVGTPGELYVGGWGVARGYLGRAELTAERFVPDPYGPAGARLYRTGDRVRRNARGEVEFLGRVDFQVKIRGFRVEPGEVEAELGSHPEVGAAAVVVREEEAGGPALVGYAAVGEGGPTGGELREWLKGRLPEYLVPAAVVVLEALPLTANGKVDRSALPAPDRVSDADAYVPPRTPEEALLAGIWAELLGVERVGATDDFFALGGHSLLAARAISRVREAFGVEVPLRALFEGATVAALAERLRGGAGSEGAVASPSPRPMPRGRTSPLSFAQERLWFVDRLEPGDAAYHVPHLVRIRGPLDPCALRRALAGVVARHEALRTVFREEGGEAVQEVVPAAALPLPVADLSALAVGERESAVRTLASVEAARPFDLERGPLLRTMLLRVGPDDHALALTLHHVVADGWSMDVLYRDLSSLYARETGAWEGEVPALPLQYADFALWQRLRLRGETLDRELGYWRERLAGAPALLEIPTDHPRTAGRGRRGGRVGFAVPEETVAALRALGREEGTTPFMTLLAAFQLLLSRYSGQDDVVVGTPAAGRTHRELEPLVGFFVNSLAIRADLSADPSFRALLLRVREAALGAFAHAEVPFERLVEELHPGRSLSHSPVFQAMFTLQADEAPAPRFPDARVRVEDVDSGRAKFDLSVALRGTPAGMAGVFAYDAGLFERETAERMAEHFVALLSAIAAAPDVRVSSLSLLDAGERRRVLETWNSTARPHAFVPAHEMFAAQAARTPDALAAVCGAERATYAELDAASARIARTLRGMGVGPETRVAVCLEPSVEMVAALLGVLRAGGAYVPLDPAYPEERLRLVVEDAGARVLVSREALAAKLPAGRAVPLLLDRDADRVREQDAGPLEPASGPENLAYVIYTSGSTGRPKGVLVEHRGLANLLAASVEEFGFREGDVAPALASFAFDIWGFEALAPLASGGAVRLVPRERVVDGGALLEECRDATVLHAVPALMRQVAEGGRDALPAVRRLFVGGDVVPPELLEAMLGAFPGAEVRVLYGPTEGTVLASAYEVGAEVPRRPTIGRPLGNVRLYVCGSPGEPLPAGVPGELFIGGTGVARGYLGRPDLTAERFVPDAFSGIPGARLYRTGDRVRWRGDGTLEFMGRTDFQVKIRGFRIEPGEVEGALVSHPEVRDAVVVPREDRPGDVRLVGYVVPEGAAAPGRADLLAWLRDRVPEHMVPAAFVVLDAFPLTPAGKVDRRALPAPEPSEPETAAAPRTPEEEILAGIWADVLGVDRVGLHDDFFERGGHSLLATRVVSRVRSELGVEIPVRSIFEAPTVAGLSEMVRAGRGDTGSPVVPVPRDRPVPLSFSQQRLWFLDRMEPVNAHHNIPVALRLEGPLDGDVLERALAEVVRRHEVLRTVFREGDGGPVQGVLPPDGFRLARAEVPHGTAGEREAAMLALAEEEARRPMDLEAGPLMRAALLRLGAEHHVLLLTVHHAVSDAWSMGVFYRELSRIYAAFAGGGASPLAELPVQYGDFAAWQHDHLRGETLERQVAYWRERLEGAPALLELPTDRPRPSLQTHRAGVVPFHVAPELRARLRALDRREGVTPFMSFLAALGVLLRRLSGQDDVVVGTPIAGRTRAETEGLIGFFVNMLALRTDLSGDPSFRSLLARVREATLGAYAHQDVPFEKLLEEMRIQRSLGHGSVYQVSLLLHNADVGLPELPGVRASVVDVGTQATPFDLALVAAELPGGGMRGSFTYNADLFDEATVEAFAAHLLAILEEAAGDPERPVSELVPVLPEEQDLQLSAWSAVAGEPVARGPVHESLREAALRTQDAVAVAMEGAEPLTYAALEKRANHLAHRLAGLGVGPESRVALYLERSPEMLVALLAVLKAGGCYVPVDPAYPADRVRLMLDDCGARVVLTRDGLVSGLPETGATVLAVEPRGTAGEADAPPRVAVEPDHAAYVIYTSGSTGRPKGVVVSHRGLAGYAAAAVDLYGIAPGDRVLQFASLSFDASAEEIYPALLGGATLVLRTEDMLSGPAEFFERCAAWGVTVLDLPTAYWHELVAALERGAASLPAGIRLVIIGGERALPERVAAWRERVGDGVRLVNTYGPTEATVVATLAELQGRPEERRLPDQPLPAVPIGRPVPGARVYVLDGEMRPLPVGARGELYIGGAGVARGYLGRPDLTAERFVPDPFSPEPGARLYRSGDVARWRRGGELEFVGRADAQVKVRGFRIEPGEVEDLLLRHPAVRDAVVVAREDEPGRARLVAYVVPAAGEAASAAELRRHLKAELPEYMVPAAFVSLDALPLTPGGKVDRRGLPAPEAPVAPTEAYVAPATEAEARLAEIWAEVLRLERVGTRDDFFELGGHSLLATQVVSRVRRELGVELPLRAVFERPTVADLAALLPSAAAAAPILEEELTAAAGMEGELLERLDELSDAEIERLLAGLSTESPFSE